MEFYFKHRYCGPLKLAIFDWAGTTIDYGCLAPTAAFIEGFRRKGIEITRQQAREPMGMEKRAHIQAISQMEPVMAQWQQLYKAPVSEEDIEQMFGEIVPVLLDVLPDYTDLIPGTVTTTDALRQLDVYIAGTTGYFEEALALCREAAARQGFVPDFTIGATQVPGGRPAPWMIYESMKHLAVFPIEAVVKIGDTVPDIEAGLNAGAWSVGIAQSGNEVGLSQEEWAVLAVEEKKQRLDTAVTTLSQAGAHYVVNTIADIPQVIEEINRRLRRGEHP